MEDECLGNLNSSSTKPPDILPPTDGESSHHPPPLPENRVDVLRFENLTNSINEKTSQAQSESQDYEDCNSGSCLPKEMQLDDLSAKDGTLIQDVLHSLLNDTTQTMLSNDVAISTETSSPATENVGMTEESSASFKSTLEMQTGESNSVEQKQKHVETKQGKKSVIFNTVTVYHFTRSQGFVSIPSQGGSTLGMKRRHFFIRKLSVDLFEEVRRRSRREILLKIKYGKEKRKREEREQIHCNSISSSTSSNSNTTASSSSSSDSDDGSFSDFSDISDSEVTSDIFLQPMSVKVRRSLLRASGVGRIDPKEKRECKQIRESRERSGCNCVNQCIPGLCECTLLGVNCHVDRVSFPCGCISDGCQNPLGRTEFDIKRVKGHLFDTLVKAGIG